jgi:hypothetical protein
MMRLQGAEELALHIYVLQAAQGDVAFDYALIAEVHHPDYLSLRDVRRIYGPVPPLDATQQASLTQMRAAVALAVDALE